MSRIRRLLWLAGAIALLAGGHAHGHTVWLGSSQYIVEDVAAASPAATVNVFFGWGEVPPVQDFIRDRSRIEQFFMRSPDGATTTLEPGASGFRAIEVELPTVGTYVFATSIKPYYYTHWDDKGVLSGGSKPQSQVPDEATVYESQLRRIYGKTLVRVGDDASLEAVKRPLGHELEIIPLVHPAGLRAGDALSFQVLYKGKPLEPVRMGSKPRVQATYIGFSQREEYAWAGELDDRGQGRLPIRVAGVWLILVEQHMPLPAGENREAKEIVAKATLMFEVR